MNAKHCIAIGFFVAALSFLAVPVPAADSGTGEGGIPSTAVARLKIDNGTAWVRSGDSGNWEEAATNYPLVERSRVSVPQGSEAEVQFRGNQILHLRGGTEVDIRQLGEKEVSYRLRNGRADLSLPKADFAPVRVKVPGNREVQVDMPGRYSLSIDRGTTRFVVRSGEGAVAGGEGSPTAVHEGEEASIGNRILVNRTDYTAPAEAPQVALTEPEQEAGVPPEVAGELQQYGDWVPTPEYGYAWRPYVDQDWEPYYYGRWVWISPYGWTWVAYEPWGWWPYHTGWWWSSPVYGWVWCPFHSFVSFDFVFGRSAFFGHRARFFPGNVRFFGRGGFVRWVPERPGQIESRSRFSSRNDTSLARWNRPVERGTVMFRGAEGRLVDWGGTRMRGANRAVGRPSFFREGNGGVGRARSGNYGNGVPSIGRGGGTRPFSGGGGRISAGSGTRGVPRGSYVARAPMSQPAGISRGFARGGSNVYRGGFRGSYSGGNRGYGGFRNSGGGENQGFGGGPRGSFGGGERGFGGGSRGFRGR